MKELFLNFLNMSITAGWIVLALVILRPLFKKAPKWIACALWGLVALRLIFPFSIESAMSLIPSAMTVPPETIYQQEPQISTGIPVLNSAVNPILSEQFSAQGYETETVLGAKVYPFEALVRVCSFIWLIGMGAMLLYMLLSFLVLKLRLREAVKSEEGYYHSDKVPSPFIFGIVNPRIYLPADLSSEDKGHVLAHERAHLKRKDHLIKPFGFFLLCFYWFNPLLWLAYILLCRDIEAACDEKVIKNMDAEGKKGYSTALLHCSVGTNARRTLSACPLAFGETGVKGRIKLVLSYKKPALWVLVGAIVLSLVLTGCLLTDPKGESLEVDDEIQRALSQIILEENYNDKRGNTKAFEGHTVFGSEEKNGDYTYYLWINYGEYTLEKGRLEHFNGFSGPAKIVMELHDEEGFVLKEYKIPRDGSYYGDDIRKMVPMKWWSRALNGQEYAEKNKDSMWEQIESWLLADGTYNYTFADYDRSYLSLKEDGTFSLILSTHGAYYPYGSYVTDEKKGLITCTTEDLGKKYVFKKDTNTLIFVKEDSAPLPEYSYNGKVRPCIPDGAIFTEPGFIPEEEFEFPQFAGTVFDIDGDGEKERFSMGALRTSGMTYYYINMQKGEVKYTTVCSFYVGVGFTVENGRLFLKRSVAENDEANTQYEVVFENNVLAVRDNETHSLLTDSPFAWDRRNEPALTLPEYEGSTFRFIGEGTDIQLVCTDKKGQEKTLANWGAYWGGFSATPIITDLNNDGYREICINYMWGSGVDGRGIYVYDVKNNASYCSPDNQLFLSEHSVYAINYITWRQQNIGTLHLDESAEGNEKLSFRQRITIEKSSLHFKADIDGESVYVDLNAADSPYSFGISIQSMTGERLYHNAFHAQNMPITVSVKKDDDEKPYLSIKDSWGTITRYTITVDNGRIVVSAGGKTLSYAES